MALKEYNRKRDFKKTAEPEGKVESTPGKNYYCIQKHDASRLHYDFRLELDGVLKSWAVPKGPSLDPAEKHLAVEVEDHPLDYGDFEGTIPQGQYGGGTVMLWDRGTWKPLGNPHADYAAGKMKFELHGEKLHGAWALVRMKSRDDAEASGKGRRYGSSDKPNWLLFKERDDEARPAAEYDIREAEDRSVSSGRSMDEIAAGKGKSNVWQSNRAEKNGKPTKTPKAASPKPASRKTLTAVVRAAATPIKSKSAKPSKTSAEPGEAKQSTKAKPLRRASSTSGKTTAKPTAPLAQIQIPQAARKAPFPRAIEPQLCTLVDAVPAGEAWLHEIKFDGYRVVAYCRAPGGKPSVQLITRGGKDWTVKFGPVVEALTSMIKKIASEPGGDGTRNDVSFVLDGEIVALNLQGRSDFQSLHRAIRNPASIPLAYYAFDIIYYAGHDLAAAPLIERKRVLESLLAAAPETRGEGVLRYSEHIQGHGDGVLDNACKLGLEGVVCKQADSPYVQKRGRYWVKVKCNRRQEFVIVGYTDPQGARSGFGALLIGVYRGDKLMGAGRVGTGFDDKMLREMHATMSKLEQKTPSIVNPPRGAEARGVHWIKPKLVAEIEFTEWTGADNLRHPAFIGLREDKDPAEVKREEPVTMSKAMRKSATTSEPEAPDTSTAKPEKTSVSTKPNQSARPNQSTRSIVSRKPVSSAKKTKATASSKLEPEPAVFEGITLSHPERVLYDEHQITKRQLAEYYTAVADWVLPYVVRRPLSLVRCPQGSEKQCFFQKHVSDGMHASIQGVRVPGDEQPYVFIDNLQGLIALVQMGVLEVHPWGSINKDLEHPDSMILDLDPDPEVKWPQVVAAAHEVRALLNDLGLKSFVKTTGGKGIHVVVPLARKNDWDEVKAFAKGIADAMTRRDPERYLATASKARRKGKIYVDYLRNGRGQTAVAAYSTRARDLAPVSMPITWEELDKIPAANFYTIENAPQYLAKLKSDPWEDFGKTEQFLKPAMIKKLQQAGPR